MQECIASWAHLFANFSWWGCLMIVVAGVQSDVYHRKVKVVSPRMRTPTSWATGRSARRQATAPSARSARPTSRLESCASTCCISGRQGRQCVANSVRLAVVASCMKPISESNQRLQLCPRSDHFQRPPYASITVCKSPAANLQQHQRLGPPPFSPPASWIWQKASSLQDYQRQEYKGLSHARRGPQAWRIIRPSADKPAGINA